MTTRSIAEKYNIDQEQFESFIEKRKLRYTTGMVGCIVDDNLVCEYVKLFNERDNNTKTADGEQVTNEKAKPFDTYNAELGKSVEGAIYRIDGVRGRHLDVFDNRCIIKTKVTIGSLLSHNATDGVKTIYYSDVVGVQFKTPGFTIGYLQLETPGMTMNNKASNFFNENSFTYDESVVKTEKMREIVAYIEERVQEIKHPKENPQTVAPAAPQISVADELLKFKQLLDMGVLTHEEFEAKKKELLNL